MRTLVTGGMLLSMYLSGSQALAQATQVLTPPNATVDETSVSYGFGYKVGQDLSSLGLIEGDLKPQIFIQGLLDAINKKDPTVEREKVQAAMDALFKQLPIRKQKANLAYMEANKKKDGVQVTATGLQYKVLKQGSGASPTADSQVTVHYEGKMTDGRVFDSSLQGQPLSIGASDVIPGWTEALTRMRVGDKWQLVIPPALGYGQQGFPPVIGPNEILLFDVELLEVK